MSWRLQGQEEYLKNKKLYKINIFKYQNKLNEPILFHEHCEFCFDKIEKLDDGYCTKDFYYWICPTCYHDFKDDFEFKEFRYKYFSLKHEINGTAYHEFKMGKYKGESWNDHSLFIDEDVMRDIELNKIFEDNIRNYNYFGPTKINEKQWKKIIDSLSNYSIEIQNAIGEIKEWVEYALSKYSYFTILGI